MDKWKKGRVAGMVAIAAIVALAALPLIRFASVIVSNPLGALAAALELGIEQSPGVAIAGVAGLIGGPVAFTVFLGSTSYFMESRLDAIPYLRSRGVDTSDPAQVLSAIRDPELMADMDAHGFTRGAIIGALDTATGALLFVTFGGRILNFITQIGIQVAGGYGGVTLAQLATEARITDSLAVLKESLAEMALAPVKLAVAAITQRLWRWRRERRSARQRSQASID